MAPKGKHSTKDIEERFNQWKRQYDEKLEKMEKKLRSTEQKLEECYETIKQMKKKEETVQQLQCQCQEKEDSIIPEIQQKLRTLEHENEV